MCRVLVCFGTRPEAIKLAPVIGELKSRPQFQTKVCVTAQHRAMLDQVLDVFDVVPDMDLDVMKENQSLVELTARVLVSMGGILEVERPSIIIVQGDTTTTFAAALAAFYRGIKVAHVEAGLRTNLKYAPFPEELNRKMTSCLADWHFAPTLAGKHALEGEGYPRDRIHVVGNTVVDALLWAVDRSNERDGEIGKEFPFLDGTSEMVLVTGHRRENFGEGLKNICDAIGRIAQMNQTVQFVYPVHLNPNVQRPVRNILDGRKNVHLIEPQDYLRFVWLLSRCKLVLTDSGGVQEEAPTLGKPVLVMRDVTERPEAVESGVAKLVGTGEDSIVSACQGLLRDESAYARMSVKQNPYGDGTSAKRIVDIIEDRCS